MCVCVCSQYTQHVSLVCFDVFCAICCVCYKMKTEILLLNSVRRILARKEIKCNPQKNWMEAKSICISQIYNTTLTQIASFHYLASSYSYILYVYYLKQVKNTCSQYEHSTHSQRSTKFTYRIQDAFCFYTQQFSY